MLDVLERHPGESGIIYRATRKDVERTAAFLCEHGAGNCWNQCQSRVQPPYKTKASHMEAALRPKQDYRSS